MNDTKPTAVVTGANRGLGLETCRQLGRQDIRVILTSRSALKGETSMRKLREEGLDVIYHQLDVTALDSVKILQQYIEKEFGELKILVNNAGVFLDHTSPDDPRAGSVLHTEHEVFQKTFATNVFGPLWMSQALIPLMGTTGCVVNVSSGMGQLAEMEGYWPAYRMSKTALNAQTRILAAELAETSIKINSVCPGWVRTDMGGPDATRALEEGARGIVWAATLPADGPSGGFFRDGEPIPW